MTTKMYCKCGEPIMVTHAPSAFFGTAEYLWVTRCPKCKRTLREAELEAQVTDLTGLPYADGIIYERAQGFYADPREYGHSLPGQEEGNG